MKLRGVRRAQIESVISSPSRSLYDPDNSSVQLEGDFGSWTLKVWLAAPWTGRGRAVVKSTAWTYQTYFQVPVSTIGRVIGHRGATKLRVQHETNTWIRIENDGRVRVRADSRRAAMAARKSIAKIAVKQ